MTQAQERIQKELRRGEEARRARNEGQARVCARRAAGWAAKEYLARQGIEAPQVSGYGYLSYLQKSELVGKEVKAALEHMTMSLAKDGPEGESYWPLEADLLDEAHWLVEKLLGE